MTVIFFIRPYNEAFSPKEVTRNRHNTKECYPNEMFGVDVEVNIHKLRI